ncbi:DUF6516 family protein [Halostagnicola sp. A-GB9-2]|uniref:toxin-antitoxin system TumE family protein n=1 Tax=Halostagnicola sp. A-GB9-2 TaxID=3048066 RepID=UPI0024C09D18|nr:DUF6516 family protein [Halostagnicola sp. A-GB9-2]MDJ1432869.1 DUF6516 family protein [Halostagnicola sp. A-GB9-2]
MGDGDDTDAKHVMGREFEFDGTYVEAEAWVVPNSDRYPEGIKYSFQYGTTDGETIFRYDNFPDHPGVGRHHKHNSDDPDDVENVDFTDLESLYKRFKQEVIDNGENW